MSANNSTSSFPHSENLSSSKDSGATVSTTSNKHGFGKFFVKLLLIGIVGAVGIVGLVFYQLNLRNNQGQSPGKEGQSGLSQLSFSDYRLPAFAEYHPVEVKVTYKKIDYSIKPDLSNIYEIRRYALTDKQKEAIAKYGFVVIPGGDIFDEFYAIYESVRVQKSCDNFRASQLL